MISEKTTIKEIYEHPIGHDVLAKLFMQLGISDKWIDNPIVGCLNLKTVKRLVSKHFNEAFFETIIDLLNQEQAKVPMDTEMATPTWWKEAVFYQIYPRSFKDSNGDGIGDLKGITSKLDYLKELGIDALWLSPIYESPLDDNGYDISNYHQILADYGTMDDFDELISELKKRDMRLIMDLVVNHTSDEHPWFIEAINNPQSDKHDYYYFSDQPNNWVSFFSGSAWRYIEQNDEYVLRLFSNKQIDLNWHNPQVRQEVADIVNFWKAKGIDGFRLDVINYIAKNSLKDGDETVGKLMEFYGIEQYYFGEKLHEYLQELNDKAMHGLFSVGETPGIGIEMSRLLSNEKRNEFNTVFMFDHLETPGHVRFDDYQYDLNFVKTYYQDLYGRYSMGEWPSLFFDNHDNPRMISKIDPSGIYRKRLGKLLATLILTQRGVPFIYQGQELGLLNQKFESIDDCRDVETLNKYQVLLEEGKSESEAFKIILAGTRDHARIPMPWHEGFSESEPWIKPYHSIEVTDESERKDETSIYHFYKELIQLRKQHQAFQLGETKFVHQKKKNYFGFYRMLEGKSFFVEMNLSSKSVKRFEDIRPYTKLIGNARYHLENELSPYEVNVYQVN